MVKGHSFTWEPANWRRWLDAGEQGPGAQYGELTDGMLEQLQAETHTLILDAGCGYGRVSARILEADDSSRIVGLDSSPKMIRSADVLKETGRFLATRASIEHLPFKSNSFDTVVCFGVLMHVENDTRALHELGRVLRPEGRLFFSFVNQANPFSLPYTIYAKVAKPIGYRLRHRRASFFEDELDTIGLQVRVIHPGFLVPGDVRLPGKDQLWRALDTFVVKAGLGLGYEPVFEATAGP